MEGVYCHWQTLSCPAAQLQQFASASEVDSVCYFYPFTHYAHIYYGDNKHWMSYLN